MIIDRVKEVLGKSDTDITYQIYKKVPRTSRVKSILKGLEYSCHGIPWLAGILICVYLYPDQMWARHLLAGLIIDIIHVAIIKAYVRRQRPVFAPQDDQMVISVDKYSFPSGHASRAVFVALFCNNHSIWTFLVWIWAVSVAISRVLLGRHHVTDVLAGVILAFVLYFFQFVTGSPLSSLLLWLMTLGIGPQFASTNDFGDSELLME